jgi:hypothetical protein
MVLIKNINRSLINYCGHTVCYLNYILAPRYMAHTQSVLPYTVLIKFRDQRRIPLYICYKKHFGGIGT